MSDGRGLEREWGVGWSCVRVVIGWDGDGDECGDGIARVGVDEDRGGNHRGMEGSERRLGLGWSRRVVARVMSVGEDRGRREWVW